MKRKFVTNLALLLLLNLLIKPIYAFGIDVGVQNAVGPGEYGNYFILLNFTLIFQILLDLGIENFSRREIARSQQLLHKYLSYILPLKFLLGIVYFVVCSVIGYFMGWKGNEFLLLLLLLFNQFLASFILYFRANLGGMHLFKTDSFMSVLDKLLVILMCGFLLIDPTTRSAFRIEWLIYTQTAAYLITACVAFGLLISKTGMVKFKFSWHYYRTFLKKSLPYALLIMLMATYLRVDSVLLGKLLPNGKEQAGLYAQSFRIIEILSNFGYLFTLILLPVFSKLLKQGESINNITRLSVNLLIVPAIMIMFGCINYRFEIIHTLYPGQANGTANVFAILALTFMGICISYIFGTLLTANGNLKQLNTMAIFAVMLNLLLNLLLIPKSGIIGAAIASAVTQIFTAVYQIISASRIFRFRADYLFLGRLIAFVTLTGTIGLLMKHLPVFWAYSFALYLIAAVVLSFILGLIRIKTAFEALFTDNMFR